MRCRDLVQVAAVVATHAPALIRRGRISHSGLQQYWTASRHRLDRWTACLKEYLVTHAASTDVPGATPLAALAWRRVRPVVEEILASELLTRTWSAVACAYDRRRGMQEIEPIMRSVFAGHLDARNRALNALVYGRGMGPQESVELNRLRRRCERWSDLLLGHLGTDDLPSEFAFDPARCQEFARDLCGDRHPVASQLVLSSLRDAFDWDQISEATSVRWNRQIAAAVLSCFGSELLGFAGLPCSLWTERLGLIAADAQDMIDVLLRLEGCHGYEKGPAFLRGLCD